MATVQTLLQGLDWKQAKTIGSSTVIPIIGEIPDSSSHIHIVDETIDGITVSELEQESVNEVYIESTFEGKVLVISGMVLKGGRQTRTPIRPFIINNQSKQKIPVNCIEQGRWVYRSQDAVSENQKEFKIHKKMVSRKTKSSYAQSGYSQSQTWGNIQAYMAENAVDMDTAPTQSYLEVEQAIYEKKEQEINEIKEQVNDSFNIENQRGIAIFEEGKLVSIEVFDNPQYWKTISNEVLNANLLDFLSASKNPSQSVKPVGFDSLALERSESLVDEIPYQITYEDLQGWGIADTDQVVYVTLNKFEQKPESSSFMTQTQNFEPNVQNMYQEQSYEDAFDQE